MNNETPVNNQHKICANCVYWNGERTPEPWFNRFSCDLRVHGICNCTKGHFMQPMPTNGGCPQFTKHPICEK